MKSLKILFSGLFLMVATLCLAQTDTKMPMFSIYEEQVKPSAHQDYLRVTKEWVAAMKQEGMNAPPWMTFSTGHTYYYLTPLKSMADFDKDMWEDAKKKMGAEKFKNLMGQFDPQITSAHNYVIKLDNKLSYLPEGTSSEGKNYRQLIYLHVKPENMEKAENLAIIIKSLFERKNSKAPYATYRSGVGAKGPYFLVAQFAKDPVEFEKMIAANNELLGEEFLNLYNKMVSYCSKVEFKDGLYHPQFSNPPAENASTANSNR